MSDRKALARAIAARSKPRFVEIKRERQRQPSIVRGDLLTLQQGRWARASASA